MPSKKKAKLSDPKAKTSDSQDTPRLKKKGKTVAKSSSKSATKATPSKAAAKKTESKSVSAKSKTASVSKSGAAPKSAAAKTSQSKISASSTAGKKAASKTNAAKDNNTKTKGRANKTPSTPSKVKESTQAVTKKGAAQKTTPSTKSNKSSGTKETAKAPLRAPAPSAAKSTTAAKASKAVDQKSSSKTQAAKVETASDTTKVKAAAPSSSTPKPTKPSKAAAKSSSKKTDLAAPTASEPVFTRPKIALASGSSAPQSSATVAPAPVTANDQPKATTTEAKPMTPRAAPTKNGVHRTGYRVNEYIVYPAHGVGQIIAIEEQEVAGFSLELFVVNFMKDKMTLKVPLPKVLAGAIRKLADAQTVTKALETLTGRARIKRTMWSRRAQEYEAKINSGDLGSIAEVVRDLYRSETQPEQSYSERQLYEAALDRMMREIAAVQKLIDSEALKLIESHLQRGPKRGSKAEANDLTDGDQEDSDLDLDTETDGDVEEAA